MPRSRTARNAGFFELIPRRATVVFFAAVFFVFAPVNLLLTAAITPSGPLGALLLMAFLSGATAVCWAATFTVSRRFAAGIVVFMFAVILLSGPLAPADLGLRPMPPSPAGLAVVVAIALGFVLFAVFIGRRGREAVRLMTEIALAQQIHASLVPALQRADDRLEVDAYSTASSEMGGDLVDMVDDGATTDLVLADVSGHGVKAGVVMGMVKAALRMAQRDERPLERLASDLNDVLDATTSAEMYATMALLRLHHAERRVECLLAGHPPVLHCRRGAPTPARLGEAGFPLGLIGGSQYASRSIALEPGDLFAAWTDGLDETMNDADEELGREAIERAIFERAQQPLAEIRRAVFDLVRAHGPQADDRSLLLVRVLR
jgi:serine phosphatase RsbU (regulator of sigma subunit)